MPSAKDSKEGYHVLFREWDGETWDFGPILEVKVDKQAYSNKLAQYLSDKVFPHIPAESILAVKLNFVSGFKRGDLPLKRWTVMKSQATKIAQSALKITRDSEYIVIRDARKNIREDLTEEELAKWTTPSFNNYLSKRAITKKVTK